MTFLQICILSSQAPFGTEWCCCSVCSNFPACSEKCSPEIKLAGQCVLFCSLKERWVLPFTEYFNNSASECSLTTKNHSLIRSAALTLWALWNHSWQFWGDSKRAKYLWCPHSTSVSKETLSLSQECLSCLKPECAYRHFTFSIFMLRFPQALCHLMPQTFIPSPE